jgi:23S rRNA (guanine745-N1)-methyltransferase
VLDGALPYLRCPVCDNPVGRGGERTLRCPRGHSFDIARQGYANLTRGRMPHEGDSAPMIEARDAFLAAGHYDFIRSALVAAAPPVTGLILDAGAGTGWYLAALLDGNPHAVGLAVDVSKPALRRAARSHPRAGAVLADLWQPLPVTRADLIVNVFAPRNGPEFARLLPPGGSLLVVTPAADHLRELVEAHGLLSVDPAKRERLTGALSAFDLERGGTVRRRLTLTGDELRTLIEMTPSARHVTVDRPAAAEVTAAVDITLFRRSDRPLPSPAADRGRGR